MRTIIRSLFLVIVILTSLLVVLAYSEDKSNYIQTNVSLNSLENHTLNVSDSCFDDYNTIYLRRSRNKCRNVLTQAMMKAEKSAYIIKFDYDLGGDTINVPKNSSLVFKGGSLKNGTLVGQNTTIINESNRPLFKNITFCGNFFQRTIYSDWFEYDNLCDLFDAIQVLATSNILTNVIVTKMTVSYLPIVRGNYQGDKTSYLFKIPSNTHVDFCDSELTLAPNDISFFYAIYIQDAANVEIKNLTLIGDIEGHTPTQFDEYSHGIYIYASKDVRIENVHSLKFWGDGMGISGYSDPTKPVNTNIIVKDCRFENNRRQGCSISKGDNILFENCDFLNTGTIKSTSPSAGVDIEPNNGEDVIKRIVFKKCNFLGNEGNYGGLLIMTARLNYDINAEAIILRNCEIDGVHQYGRGGGYFKSCIIHNDMNRNNCLNASKNQTVEDCTIDVKGKIFRTQKSQNIQYRNNTLSKK